MSATETVPTKVCSKCGNEWPLDGFHKDGGRSPSGRHGWCKSCMNDSVRKRQAKRRAEMGEEAYLAYQREITRRSRQRTGNSQGKTYERASWRAAQRLKDAHPEEYADLLDEELRRERHANQ
jgi:hypothetical protein